MPSELYRNLTIKAFPLYCKEKPNSHSCQLSVHINNLTLFLNYFVGTDGFQLHAFLLQYMEAILLNS